jgi:DNA-binding transcriptional regulator YhcF (GntR family)
MVFCAIQMKNSKNKHTFLVKHLRELIRSKKPGDQIENDRVLSAQLGVSNVTLRTAMLDLVKEGIVERRVGAGTFVIERKVHRHLAIVVSQEILQSSRVPYVHLSAMSIIDELNHCSIPYKLYMLPCPTAEENELAWPEAKHIEKSGLSAAIEADEIQAVVSVAISRNSGWTHALEARGTPIIGISGDKTFKHRIQNDPISGIQAAVRHLSQFGHERIGFIFWKPPEEHTENPSVTAFMDEMNAVGLPVFPELLKNDSNPAHPASGWQLFRELWLSGVERPDALIFADDRLFVSAAGAMLELGIKVPRDLQVATHWNKGSGFLCPFPTARYVFDMSAVGKSVLELLKREAEEPDLKPQSINLPTEWFTEGQYDTSMNHSFIAPLAGVARHKSCN